MGPTMTLQEIIGIIEDNRSNIRKFGVRRIGVFGSYTRDEQKPVSDLDLIVEFEHKTFDNYMDLKLFLEGLLGLNVDLVTAESIKPRLRRSISESAVYV